MPRLYSLILIVLLSKSQLLKNIVHLVTLVMPLKSTLVANAGTHLTCFICKDATSYEATETEYCASFYQITTFILTRLNNLIFISDFK